MVNHQDDVDNLIDATNARISTFRQSVVLEQMKEEVSGSVEDVNLKNRLNLLLQDCSKSVEKVNNCVTNVAIRSFHSSYEKTEVLLEAIKSDDAAVEAIETVPQFAQSVQNIQQCQVCLHHCT